MVEAAQANFSHGYQDLDSWQIHTTPNGVAVQFDDVAQGSLEEIIESKKVAVGYYIFLDTNNNLKLDTEDLKLVQVNDFDPNSDYASDATIKKIIPDCDCGSEKEYMNLERVTEHDVEKLGETLGFMFSKGWQARQATATELQARVFKDSAARCETYGRDRYSSRDSKRTTKPVIFGLATDTTDIIGNCDSLYTKMFELDSKDGRVLVTFAIATDVMINLEYFDLTNDPMKWDVEYRYLTEGMIDMDHYDL